jgi:hypothetical protein
MIRYLMYKHKIINMKDKNFLELIQNPSKSHLNLKRGWHKDVDSWLNHWRIDRETTLQNINTIKSTITTKFKEKLWLQQRDRE